MNRASALRALEGVPFTKMTGSGNDFVVFSAADVAPELVSSPEVVRAICNRHNGIGADGVVLLQPESPANAARDQVALRYFNSDGSLGELCGNATLCSTQLSVARGYARAEHVVLNTDAGEVLARLRAGTPQIDLAPVTVVRDQLSGLPIQRTVSHVGFALVGVPHVVLVTEHLDEVEVVAEGRPIRQHRTLAPAGANVNWLAPIGDGRWRYRTYERGVEGETLACGTGAVACAILLTRWGLADGPVSLVTASGKPLEVTFRDRPAAPRGAARAKSGAAAPPNQSQDAGWLASLAGEGRIVFQGTVGALD